MSKTIEISRELAERLLNWDVDGIRALSELRTVLAAPVVERQEAVAWRTGSIVWPYKADATNHADQYGMTIEPLYASPPAPVAVVPRLQMSHVVEAHMEIPGCPILTSNQCHALAVKLNAFLDKVKELNQ